MSKRDEIYDLIVSRLIDARYAFGDRLLVKELSAETGISRQPIMSALGALSADGLVRIIPQVGCEVIDPTISQVGDFFLMFQRMEGLLSQLAAKRRTPEQIRRLRAVQRQLTLLEEAEGEYMEYLRLNQTFHNTIHEMADSPLLDEKQRNNFNMCDFFINHTSGFGAFQKEAVSDHEQIIDAIANGHAERAALIAEAHIAAIANTVLSAMASKADKAPAD